MSLQISTELKALYMQVLYAFASTFSGGIIRVFNGTRADSPDQPENQHGATRIGNVTNSGLPIGYTGFGLRLVASGPYIVNNPLDQWVLTPTATATATWMRYCADPYDAGGLSHSAVRMDADVGVNNDFEMVLPTTNLVVGTRIFPLSFLYTFPPILS